MTGVDVVVPCYNYARYLEWCVGTLLNQPGVRVRVLIIDDASEDDTPEVGERLAARDPRVEFRRHEKNAGHTATYNEGLLGWASSEYSLLISADDGLSFGALARATQLMNAHPAVGMTYGMATIIGADHSPEPADSADREYRIVPGSRFLQQCCLVCNPVPTATALVRTELQQRLGGYRADLPHSGDMEMWMRFALQGPIGVLRAAQGYRRRHGRNMSAGYHAGPVGDRRESLLACRLHQSSHEATVPEFHTWYLSMRDRFVTEALQLAYDAFESGDVERYSECVAFAAELRPSLHRTSGWQKLKVKQLLGPRGVHLVRAVWQRLRGVDSTPEARVAHGPPDSIGWWPNDTLS